MVVFIGGGWITLGNIPKAKITGVQFIQSIALNAGMLLPGVRFYGLKMNPKILDRQNEGQRI